MPDWTIWVLLVVLVVIYFLLRRTTPAKRKRKEISFHGSNDRNKSSQGRTSGEGRDHQADEDPDLQI